MSGVLRYTDITPDGLRVWCSSPESIPRDLPREQWRAAGVWPVIQFGDDAPIDLPLPGLQLRVSPDGSRAVLKGWDGSCLVVARSQRTVTAVGTIAIDNAAGFTPDGRLVWCPTSTSYVVEGDPAPHAMPNTSQGFLAIDLVDGVVTPVWTDTNRTRTVDGVTYGLPHQCGGWLVGQAWDGSDGLILRAPDGVVTGYEVQTPWPPRVSADGTVAVSLPGLFLLATDFAPLTVAVPTLPAIDRPIWLAPGEVSGAPPDGAGYHAAPGNAEIILRPADLALRVDPSKPFICIAEVAAQVTNEPCIGLFAHLGDDQSGWGTPIANARAQAARLSVPVYAYRDTGASIAGELDTLRLLGVDRILLQAYPDRDGDVPRSWARIRANADGCGPMLAGFLAATYTGSGAWPLTSVLRLLALTWDEMRARTALTWFGLWPWHWHRAGRGGPNEHPEIRAMVEAMAAVVNGTPDVRLPPGPSAPDGELPPPVGPPSPEPDPDPIPDLPSEEDDDMPKALPDAPLFLVDDTGLIVSLTPDGRLERREKAGPWEKATPRLAGDGTTVFAYEHGTLCFGPVSLEYRPAGADGAWERAQVRGGRAFVEHAKDALVYIPTTVRLYDFETGLPL